MGREMSIGTAEEVYASEEEWRRGVSDPLTASGLDDHKGSNF